jgi:hypothetical protein
VDPVSALSRLRAAREPGEFTLAKEVPVVIDGPPRPFRQIELL